MTTSSSKKRSWFGLSTLILFVAGIGFFVLSVVALGVMPGQRLEDAIQRNAPLTQRPYTAAEARGRQLYASEGCAYCHTEQVRHTEADTLRWGAPTQPWETRYDTPQLWGTRRIGPDLAREAGVRSHDWQMAHLYNPRSVVPGSVMPGYPWLFEANTGKPTQRAEDLVAYLETLGRARRQAAGLGDADTAERLGFDANPSRTRLVTPGAALAAASAMGSTSRGATLFAEYCSGCHGRHGEGQSAAARTLLPRPANLTAFDYSSPALMTLLLNGVAGSSMPAWRDLSDQQLADLVAYVQSLHPVTDDPAADTAILAQGATLYAANCTSCHGVQGDGHGPAADLYQPRPFDFRHLMPDVAEIDRVVREGVPGTAMPAFPGLSDGERRLLAAYIRSLSADAVKR